MQQLMRVSRNQILKLRLQQGKFNLRIHEFENLSMLAKRKPRMDSANACGVPKIKTHIFITVIALLVCAATLVFLLCLLVLPFFFPDWCNVSEPESMVKTSPQMDPCSRSTPWRHHPGPVIGITIVKRLNSSISHISSSEINVNQTVYTVIGVIAN